MSNTSAKAKVVGGTPTRASTTTTTTATTPATASSKAVKPSHTEKADVSSSESEDEKTEKRNFWSVLPGTRETRAGRHMRTRSSLRMPRPMFVDVPSHGLQALKRGTSRPKQYLCMVREAMRHILKQRPADDDRKGYVSIVSIQHYIYSNYKVKSNFKQQVLATIKTAVENKKLQQKNRSVRFPLKKKKTAKAPSPKKRKVSTAKDAKTEPKKARKSTTTGKTKTDKTTEKKKPTEKSRQKSVAQKDTKKREKKEPAKKTKAKKTVAKKSTTERKKTSKSKVAKNLLGDLNAVAVGSSDIHWQYLDGTWKPYSAEADATLEKYYSEYQKNQGMYDVPAVHSGEWDYCVDFATMKQTNIQHHSHTSRNIRRLPDKSSS
ncbi:hypothetical protein Pelo_7982 [Pelomyxa schiedti]|nr:hypothetical protein Pelo_7982 [Pelomyxa schiedti]